MSASTATRSSSIRRPANSPPPTNPTSPSPVGNGILAKGASARSAVPTRVSVGALNAPAKRAGAVNRISQIPTLNGTGDAAANDPHRLESRDALLASLKRETQEKEELTLQLQASGDELAVMRKENDSLLAVLTAAEQRVAEQDADQLRMEQETETRMDIMEKLRTQIKELEKDKRDAIRRYNEQAHTFEAERQSHYDTEQHLRSRIQSLSQVRKRSPGPRAPPKSPSIAPQESEDELDDASLERNGEKGDNKDSPIDEDNEPAEMTALRLELHTLSVSHASTQVTLQLLQNELADLKRVNNELQEENESYNILLREKTLTGNFDLLRATATSDDEEQRTEGGLSFAEERDRKARAPSVRSQLTLDVVPEGDEQFGVVSKGLDSPSGSRRTRRTASPARSKRGQMVRSSSPSSQDSPPGDNLGDLPISGPGLDLAAELGRAENKSISGSEAVEPAVTQASKVSNAPQGSEEIRHLRQEIKTLKDANKALSLYASKILDRIIAQEGFENVLAVDYETKRKPAASPAPPPAAPKPRPKSSFFPSLSSSTIPTPPAAAPPPLSRTEPEPSSVAAPSSASMAKSSSAPAAAPASAADKRARRGLSMDWKGLSFGGLFGGGQAPEPEPKNDKLRPLTLKASSTITGSSSLSSPAPVTTSTPIPGARKLAFSEEEDDEDRRERERLAATLKLMGIEKPDYGPLRSPPIISSSNPGTPPGAAHTLPAQPPPSSGRIPFFTRFGRSSESVPHSPVTASTFGMQQSSHQHSLTAEALEQAEAESALANLDAQEKLASAEYAKMGASAPAFTELGSPRAGSSLSENFMKRSRGNKSRSQNGGSGGRTSYDADGNGGGEGSVISHHSRSGSVNTIFSAGAMSVDIEHLGASAQTATPARSGEQLKRSP